MSDRSRVRRFSVGQPYRLTGRGRWGLRYHDAAGVRRRVSPFPSARAAREHYRDVILPELEGRAPAGLPVVTLDELCDRFLERHAASRSPRTIRSLRERLVRPRAAFGERPVESLAPGELADFAAGLPERWRPAVMRALRQVLAAGIRYGVLDGPNAAVLAGPNPAPPPRPVRVYSLEELEALELELGPAFGPVVPFAAATGLRPSEWAALERRHVDRDRRILTVDGTKTRRSRREVPLSAHALEALDRVPARLDVPLIFPAERGGRLNLDNFRRRAWAPAVEAAGIARPARLYDLRSTFASRALAAGVAPFELARIMGTSIVMIELHYGALIAGAADSIAARLDEFAYPAPGSRVRPD
jgi:integrase